MALKERLQSAREDYRAVELDLGAVPAALRPRRGGRLVAAAATVALVAAGVGWWSMSDDPTEVAAGPPSTTPEVDDPEPPGAVAEFAEEISLNPDGPYTDGQVVTVSVPEGFAADLINRTPEGARQCAVLADGPGGPSEWCDLAERSVIGSATSSSVDVRVSRRLFTPTGERDCEDPAVTCRIVLGAGDGRDVASAVLRFDDTDPEAAASIELAATDTPGVVTLRTEGVEPHPSWLELRASDPASATDHGPFRVSVCAFAEPDEPADPWGENRWGTTDGGRPVPGSNCDEYGEVATLDPDDTSTPTSATVPTWFLGYGGWSDCRVDQCFVRVRRTIVYGTTPGGGLFGDDEVVTSALIPSDLVEQRGSRPELRIVTPGPHTAGQELAIEVTGLASDRTTSVGVCQADNQWGCGYLGGPGGPALLGNGTHVIRLPEQFSCPTRCYLELDSQGEGMPPLATAALDTE
jgi:hypothetical protein